MKNLLISGVVLLASAFVTPTQAQISVSINIGSQPSWGPTGYDHVDYYYIPDIQCYYYVPAHQFIYQNRGHWTFATELPARYRGFDLYHSHKVVMNEPQPYLHFDEHRVKYAQYKGNPENQVFIRDSHDDRYREHWHDQHEADEEWRHHDNGNHNGERRN